MRVISSLLCHGLLLPLLRWSAIAQAAALPTTPSSSTRTAENSILLDESAYSFEQFLSDYGRAYHNATEYPERQTIFYENLHQIVQHNRQKKLAQPEKGGFWMGINQWADRRAEELLKGYNKYQSSKYLRQQQQPHTAAVPRRLAMANTGWESLAIDLDEIHDLPTSVDWRTQGVTTPVKSQGLCGSCWAFASTAVLESHVALQTGILYELSPQELVSCAPNAQHCGGNGGCTGSTAELAFDFVRTSGMVTEWQFGYQDGEGSDIQCPLSSSSSSSNHTITTTKTTKHPKKSHRKQLRTFRNAVAGITDYAVLPSNNYTVLMNVVAKLGPVAVSVACLPWHLYHSGVFYAPLLPGRATDVDHLVVLEGYGTDMETGEDYWIVRNSWGPRWGEKGYIRLKRVGDQDCGVDETPIDGSACTLDPDGHTITPVPQTICGNSGILYDTSIPLGGYLL